MRAPEAVRFGAVSVEGMALCCSLTALATAGILSVTVRWLGGSLGLGVVAGLLVGALVVARRRDAHGCCDVELPGAATDEPHRDHAA